MRSHFIRKVLAVKDFGTKSAVHRFGLREYRLECGHIVMDYSNRAQVRVKVCSVCAHKARLEEIGAERKLCQ